jgi:hypothetical protein
MKNLFAPNPNKVDHYQHQVNSLQSAYREAIQMNKEFQEVKKIYADLKKSEKELEKAIKDKEKRL